MVVELEAIFANVADPLRRMDKGRIGAEPLHDVKGEHEHVSGGTGMRLRSPILGSYPRVVGELTRLTTARARPGGEAQGP